MVEVGDHTLSNNGDSDSAIPRLTYGMYVVAFWIGQSDAILLYQHVIVGYRTKVTVPLNDSFMSPSSYRA